MQNGTANDGRFNQPFQPAGSPTRNQAAEVIEERTDHTRCESAPDDADDDGRVHPAKHLLVDEMSLFGVGHNRHPVMVAILSNSRRRQRRRHFDYLATARPCGIVYSGNAALHTPRGLRGLLKPTNPSRLLMFWAAGKTAINNT
jgi:hypothetical protein